MLALTSWAGQAPRGRRWPTRRTMMAAAPPGGERRRMEDVARRAGVSQMTVSRALRTPGKVAPATRARVASAVAELDYLPDLVAGGLAAQRSPPAAGGGSAPGEPV